MKANNPKTPQEMYDDLAGIEEGGSLYTLKREESFSIEYLVCVYPQKSQEDSRFKIGEFN
ncbi:hypothetical protein [Natrinema pallidum]|uniref:hypothetical protein n=1 Tax=Natrinema pallidum TaxID=69527 RepID=UPI001269805A|nr:hypothetical protein [Natrinema pallidum]